MSEENKNRNKDKNKQNNKNRFEKQKPDPDVELAEDRSFSILITSGISVNMSCLLINTAVHIASSF
ncbi:hypothetical protein [Lentibacillus sp. CBA3610]|uniref:hypothetical protein n=1 Tax=Lentibacillus sp. CBA3610 TaxID=2518176 RepID=UPI0015951F15|nr:hypothetical protein [Lentibacillus sp. CBA3610]